MARSRALIVTLVAALALVGAPLPVHAGPRFPATLDKSFILASGLVMRATSARGALMRRGPTSLPIRANLVSLPFRTDNPDAAGDALTFETRFGSDPGSSDW